MTGNRSVKEVARMLRESGFAFRKSKAAVPQSTVHNILRNLIYTGNFEWDGKLYKGRYAAIISTELWEAAQAILENRSASRPKKRKHDFAFSGLIRCGHTGTYLVGEIKKGRYVYYRAMGAKGIPYVKEEELERQFGEALKRLRFDAAVLDWLAQALKESHADKQKFHEEMLARLQAEYARLEGRIEAMYVDKLDGKITTAFFDERAAAWRREQQDIMERIQRLQDASQTYINDGIRLLELAQSAYILFVKQTPAEKRRLLNFMVSNCVWKDGELTVTYKQPFDMLAEYIAGVDDDMAPEGDNFVGFEKWPEQDTYS